MKTIILFGLLISLVFVSGCFLTSYGDCLIDTAKEICIEKNGSFFSSSTGSTLSSMTFSCIDENRELKKYYFTYEEKEKCKNE